MFIMINGSFGVGKTTVATYLCEQIPNAVFFDPEELGGYARQMTAGIRSGEEDTDDFQDIELWRVLTVTTGQTLYTRYQRPIVVPMTLSHRSYLETIRVGFEAVAPVAHFCLTAPLETIQQRLIRRGNEAGSWVWQKAEHCAPLLYDPYYSEHIATEGRLVSEIASEIMAKLSHRIFGQALMRKELARRPTVGSFLPVTLL